MQECFLTYAYSGDLSSLPRGLLICALDLGPGLSFWEGSATSSSES